MKRLFLSNNDKKIAGVCGGIAEYFAVDPTLVRLLTAAACLVTGILPLVVGYLLAWAIIPHRP
jgi:phage shock protein PspC (stress-responsive transcriptional regulator)